VRIGIDLGGTKIEVALLNAQNEFLYRYREPTIRGNYADTCQQIVKLIFQLDAQYGVADLPIGIGIPGTIAKQSGLVKNANSTWLNGQPLLADLNRVLDGRVRIANDANCFALSEALFGHAQGAQSVFGVIIGTGCGGGLVFDGQLITGVNGIAGEWGHNPLAWQVCDKIEQSHICYCGQRDCSETFLSGPGWVKRSNQHYQTFWPDAQAIYQAYQQGDRLARAAFADYSKHLAQGLASVINVFDPEVIVLGGGLSQMSALYETVPSLWSNWIFSDCVDTRLVSPKLGDSSGVVGAAYLW
jgi:fructokinase